MQKETKTQLSWTSLLPRKLDSPKLAAGLEKTGLPGREPRFTRVTVIKEFSRGKLKHARPHSRQRTRRRHLPR